jgi:xylan 1,4-beta-xylosidase
VWNEPNIDFWAGTQEEYFELYKQSVMAIKKIDANFRVGGPSTAQLAWVPDLIRYCVQQDLPIDFVSSHVYPNDPQKYIFGQDHLYSFEQVIPKGLELVKHQVESSRLPKLPIWITEWSSQNPAFIADTIKNCIGLVEAMSYWTFSNVFEELGVPSRIFNDTFGMLDQWGIARPSLHAFAMLHKLGDSLLQSDPGPMMATRRADGSLAIMIWNLVPATDSGAMANGNPLDASGGSARPLGPAKSFRLKLNGFEGRKAVSVSRVDEQTGTAIPKWKEMGSPKYPTTNEIEQLRRAAELPKPEIRSLPSGEAPEVSIELPPNGLALLEFSN